MHKFSTTSGKVLWYDVTDNRISLWSPLQQKKTCPVINFSSPNTLEADKITMFTIEMTQQCNLRCTYCCYSGTYNDRRIHNNKHISIDTLNSIIKFIEKHYDKTADEITICFYGGEALLVKDKIDWTIQRLLDVLGQQVRFSLSTNGLALTEDVIDWICSYPKFVVNVTIDGDKIMHDKHRKTLSGKGSYDIILKNLELFKTKFPDEYNNRIRFLATVYSWKDVLELDKVWDGQSVLRGIYPVHISHIIPDFSDKSRTYDTWDDKNIFYHEAFKAYMKGQKGILSNCFKKLTDIIARRSYHHLSSNLRIKTCYQSLFSCFINVDGDLYACEKFCGEFSIGNVSDGIDQIRAYRQLERFTARKNNHCSTCWAQRFCRMCMTSLNYKDEEIKLMCNMERDTIDLALRYFCEQKDWERSQKINK